MRLILPLLAVAQVIGATFQGLLRLYDDQVLRTLGLACIKLLDSEWRSARSRRSAQQLAQQMRWEPPAYSSLLQEACSSAT